MWLANTVVRAGSLHEAVGLSSDDRAPAAVSQSCARLWLFMNTPVGFIGGKFYTG